MNILIGNAWPYANGTLHLGRIAVLLPGDILARYHRMMGDDVVFVSGTDCHGAPVTTKAEEENITPLQAVEKYHEEFQRAFSALGFSFDIFEKTHTKYHSDLVQGFILSLYNKGYIYEKDVEQDGVLTTHLYFSLSKFENDLKRLYIRQVGWRENARKIMKRYMDEGLRDKAVTRDFHWGVEVPLDGYEDKKIFVWIEAVMGYLTASMKCVEERDENWLDYWQGDDSRIYLVHGQDNIPFHTIIFPSILAGLGIKNPPIRIISSEHLKLEGKNFSAAKNWAVWGEDIVKTFGADRVRYYLTKFSPEDKISDFTWRDFINTCNNDLTNKLDSFIYETFSLINKEYLDVKKVDKVIKDEIMNLYFNVGDLIEEGHFSKALSEVMRFIDKYKNTKNIDFRIQIIANISNLLEPFMPFTAERIRTYLNIKQAIWSFVEVKSVNLGKWERIFEEIDKKVVNEELKKLKENKF